MRQGRPRVLSKSLERQRPAPPVKRRMFFRPIAIRLIHAPSDTQVNLALINRAHVGNQFEIQLCSVL